MNLPLGTPLFIVLAIFTALLALIISAFGGWCYRRGQAHGARLVARNALLAINHGRREERQDNVRDPIFQTSPEGIMEGVSR